MGWLSLGITYALSWGFSFVLGVGVVSLWGYRFVGYSQLFRPQLLLACNVNLLSILVMYHVSFSLSRKKAKFFSLFSLDKLCPCEFHEQGSIFFLLYEKVNRINVVLNVKSIDRNPV